MSHKTELTSKIQMLAEKVHNSSETNGNKKQFPGYNLKLQIQHNLKLNSQVAMLRTKPKQGTPSFPKHLVPILLSLS